VNANFTNVSGVVRCCLCGSASCGAIDEKAQLHPHRLRVRSELSSVDGWGGCLGAAGDACAHVSLVSRPNIIRAFAKNGFITHASNDMVMITKVMASCNPGYSLIAWEQKLQRLCNQEADDGSLLGCCLMFGENHVVGGASKNAYTNGIVGQVTFSFWVPKDLAVRVDEWCGALVVEMERQISFPTELRGHFKNATNDPLGLGLPLAKFKEMISAESDVELEWIVSHLGKYTKSVERIKACKEEKERRYWIEVVRIGCIF